MNTTDFMTVIGTLLGFFTAGCGLGYFIGYRLGKFDQREEDRKQKNNRPDAQS